MTQFVSGAKFYNIYNFQGNWIGSYDGREATLTIVGNAGTANGITLTLTFTDNNVKYTGEVTIPIADIEKTTCLNNITLKDSSNGTVSWPKLMLHTWDINYMSGYSEWNGNSYGMSFWQSNI